MLSRIGADIKETARLSRRGASKTGDLDSGIIGPRCGGVGKVRTSEDGHVDGCTHNKFHIANNQPSLVLNDRSRDRRTAGKERCPVK